MSSDHQDQLEPHVPKNVPIILKRIQVLDHCMNTATDKDHAADLIRTIEYWHSENTRLRNLVAMYEGQSLYDQ